MRAKAVAEQTQHERKRRKIVYREGLERAQEQAPTWKSALPHASVKGVRVNGWIQHPRALRCFAAPPPPRLGTEAPGTCHVIAT